MGRHRLPAGGDDCGAAVRPSRRPFRAAADVAWRAGYFHRSIAGLRSGADIAAADRGARRPGPRRRRLDDPRASADRRACVAARARPLLGLFRHRVRACEHLWAGAWGLSHRAPELARGVCGQSSTGAGRRHPGVAHSAGGHHPARSLSPRHYRRLAVHDVRARAAVRAVVGRKQVRLAIVADGRASGRRADRLRAARSLGATRGGSGDSDPLLRGSRHCSFRRGGDLFRGSTFFHGPLPAAVPAARPRTRHRPVGPAVAADYALDGRLVHHHRPSGDAHWRSEALSAARAGARDAGLPAACGHGQRRLYPDGAEPDGSCGRRTRDGDATDAGRGSARCRTRIAGGGDGNDIGFTRGRWRDRSRDRRRHTFLHARDAGRSDFGGDARSHRRRTGVFRSSERGRARDADGKP